MSGQLDPGKARSSTTAARLVAAGAAIFVGAPILLLIIFAVALLGTPDTGIATGAPTEFAVSVYARRDIPTTYLRLYQQAASHYGLDWSILAAVGSIETDHGRSREPGVRAGVNSAGCCGGPMQFWVAPPHPNTWDQYGVDANGDGEADPYDAADAVTSAARYLQASGAPGDWHRALFSYNHADWYVDRVLAQAGRYRGKPTDPLDNQLEVPAGGDRLSRLIASADEVDRARIPYCYGGGHATTRARPGHGSYCWYGDPDRQIAGSPDLGLDCSSSVSLLLQVIGYDIPTMTSGGLAGWGRPGPGRHVTIWANDGHVFLVIDGRYWGTSQQNYRHGPGWHGVRPTAGFVARHPPGL